jgi:excinuclease ABC subunit B
MQRAIEETYRRREIQQKYNKDHGITPKGIAKEITEGLRAIIPEKEKSNKLDLRKIPREELPQIVKELSTQMQLAAANLEFERAAELRDQIEDIKLALEKKK